MTSHATATDETAASGPTDILIVGTLGGGGIHHYVDEQAERLPDHYSISVHDMASQPTGSGLVWFLVSFLRSVWAALKFPFRARPDIAHVHSSHRFSFYRAAPYVLFITTVWRRPVIFHIHGSSFDDFAMTESTVVRWLQSLVLSRVDRVIVLSEYWREILAERVPPEKIHVLPNAVDPSEYDPGFDDDPPHVVFVSNLVERKGVIELVEALDILVDRSVDFRASIAGKGPLSELVRDVAARHENVTQLGYVSELEKRELLDSGAVFVLPTFAEGLPIAMLEGMAGGNAVVSTTVGSIPEVIHEENGILIDPGDVIQLANAIETLVSDIETTREMARRNRTLIEAEYSWDRMTDRLQQMYETEWRKAPITRTIAQ
jgi:glycosyltransferase involved in cell wall biosynthesis